jgi:hypothetical protein
VSIERRLRQIEANVRERAQSIPPSPEVLEQMLAERDKVWRELGEAVRAAKEEGRQIIDGSKFDRRYGPNRDTSAVIVDPVVKAAYRRAMDGMPVPYSEQVPRNRQLPEPNRHAEWLLKRLIWDEKGNPWDDSYRDPLAR